MVYQFCGRSSEMPTIDECVAVLKSIDSGARTIVPDQCPRELTHGDICYVTNDGSKIDRRTNCSRFATGTHPATGGWTTTAAASARGASRRLNKRCLWTRRNGSKQ